LHKYSRSWEIDCREEQGNIAFSKCEAESLCAHLSPVSVLSASCAARSHPSASAGACLSAAKLGLRDSQFGGILGDNIAYAQ
jgi:hypothetical protein